MLRHSIIIFCSALLFLRCGKDIDAPAYLEIDHFILENNINASSLQGELTHNFTDAWVYIDGEIIGIFELPCRLPLNDEGTKKITVAAGVRNNGISSTKVQYSFVKLYNEDIELVRNKTVKVTPKTMYKDHLSFWIEDFEDASVKINSTIYSKTDLFKANDPSILKYGNYYGQINLNSSDSLYDALTSLWNIPKGKDVYIEIDFYNTNSLLTGLMAVNNNGFQKNPFILLNKQSPSAIQWKKIYLDIREMVGNSSGYEHFQLMLTAVLDKADETGFICLDNIKLIH